MRSPSLSRLGVTVAIALACGAALAQQGANGPAGASPAARPKIGLALSGGGARGAAHLGVLKVLEELRVPVDCIAGTSMGSVVGGAFAAGTSPADMEKLIVETDWGGLFTDSPPRAEIAPRRKQEDYRALFAMELGIRGSSIRVPKGIVVGVNVESFLRYLTEPAADVQNFSKLPIPFRAVAADIETGEPVVLAHGNLAQAMRASMAIPGALSPVEINGRLLVDGGIANNLPIDVARGTCGEVIIAVNISTPPMEREEMSSALSIVGQLMNFLGKERVDKQLASLGERDVLIQPELGNITSASFERMSDAIRIGEAAARSQADALRRFSLPEAQYSALRKRQTRPRGATLGRVDEIRFEGLERSNSAVLAQLMETKPGEEVTEASIASDLRRIYGRGDFDSVDYRIEQGPETRVLVIRAREKETGPNYLRFGLSLSTATEGDSYFNALARYRRTWLNSFGAEWVAEAQVGQSSRLFTEFYQPLRRNGNYFVAPYAEIGKSYRGVYVNDERVAEYRTRDTHAGIELGTVFGQWGELRLGPIWRAVRSEVRTGSAILPELDSNVSGLRLSLFGDRMDEPWFSRDGHRIRLSLYSALKAMAADSEYTRGEAFWNQALTFGPHTLQGTLYGGTGFGTNVPTSDAFLLGGPFRLSAYAINQFAGQQAVFGSLRYLNQVKRLPSPLGSGVYAGASFEIGRVDKLYEGRDTTGALWSTAFFVGASTFLGPAWLGLGLSPGGYQNLFLVIGIP